MKDKKIVIGVPPKAHVSLANDEISGLQALGYDCHTVSYGRNDQSAGKLNKLIFTIRNAFRIVRKLYQTKPALLYLNSRFEPAGSTRDYISLFIIKLFYWGKIKIIIKSHGSDCTVLTRKSFYFKKMVIPFLTRNVDAWFFLSTDEKALIEQQNKKIASRVHIVPNIIDPSRCIHSQRFKDKYQLADDKFKILFVGRMVKVKGVFDIIEAIPLLPFRNQCQFIFVGEGDDLSLLKQKVTELKIGALVHFKGYLPDAECDHFYANTDALIFPTYDTEGFPMALFKSVASGLPVVTTRIRAARDYLAEPANGIWVERQSPSSIVNAISRLYLDKDLRQTIKRNNLLLGLSFSKERVAKQTNEVFQLLISNPKNQYD